MSELAEYFNVFRENGKEKRTKNRKTSPLLLAEHGIQFESRNNGAHLLIETTKGRVNFYPGTGLYNGALSGRGVFRLLEDLAALHTCGGLDHCKHITMGNWRKAYCKRFDRLVNHDQPGCIEWRKSEANHD